MKKSTFEQIYKQAKKEKKLIHLVLDALASYGGYSSGNVVVIIDPVSIYVKDEYIILDSLHYTVRGDFSDSRLDESKLSLTVGHSKLNTVWVEYEKIILGGIE